MKKLKGTSASNISKTFLKLYVKNTSACNKQEKVIETKKSIMLSLKFVVYCTVKAHLNLDQMHLKSSKSLCE